MSKNFCLTLIEQIEKKTCDKFSNFYCLIKFKIERKLVQFNRSIGIIFTSQILYGGTKIYKEKEIIKGKSLRKKKTN
jgi:hypothetical protein